MPYVQLNQANVYYEVHGQGKPLVLVSGYGCDHSFWGGLLEPLAANFEVLIFDLRGSGQTVYDKKDFTLETLGEDTIRLINALGWKDPCILGHSMGGAISLYIAAKYAERIPKLILFNCASKLSAIASKALNSILELQKIGVSIDLVIDCFMPWAFSDAFLADPQKILLYKKNVAEYPFIQTVEGNARQLSALDMFDGGTLLKNIRAQSLVVGTDRDLLVSKNEFEFIANNIFNARLKMMSGSHVMLVEQPEIFAELILSFLNESI